MRRLLAAAAIGLAWPGASPAQDAVAVPFALPTPEGWRTETIPFPPEFAPELDYDGLEELRFAPGMFDADAQDFWSYAFVWWLPADVALDTERLTTDLRAYFVGLTSAVAESRDLEPQEAVFACDLQKKEGGAGWAGTVTTRDAFVTQQAVTLNTRVTVRECSGQDRIAALFEFSPRPESHEIWGVLGRIRDGFRCVRAGENESPR